MLGLAFCSWPKAVEGQTDSSTATITVTNPKPQGEVLRTLGLGVVDIRLIFCSPFSAQSGPLWHCRARAARCSVRPNVARPGLIQRRGPGAWPLDLSADRCPSPDRRAA